MTDTQEPCVVNSNKAFFKSALISELDSLPLSVLDNAFETIELLQSSIVQVAPNWKLAAKAVKSIVNDLAVLASTAKLLLKAVKTELATLVNASFVMASVTPLVKVKLVVRRGEQRSLAEKVQR